MLATYRRVLGLPGALVFCLSGLVARLPMSMVGLGIVLLVSSRTGSYGFAGGVSAAFIAFGGVFGVVQARLVDGLGQRRVLLPAVGGFSVGIVAMMVTVRLDVPAPWPHVWAALAGACFPQVGSCVRARWSFVLPDPQLLHTAYAVEAVADEVVFIVGPALVTLLATSVDPLVGLGTAVAAGLLGTTVFAAQQRSEPPPRRGGLRERPSGAMPWAALAVLLACTVALGVLLGGAEVATVAFSDEHGHRSLAGLLLAGWALGSLVAGVVTGTLTLSSPHATRFRWGLLALTALMVPMPFIDSFAVLALILFLSGFSVSPTLIAAVAWVQDVVPPDRLTEGMTLFTTGLTAGVAPGAAVVGHVVDTSGASAGFWVPVVAGTCGVALAFAAAAVSGARPSPSGSSG